jgi:hypothetical protein
MLIEAAKQWVAAANVSGIKATKSDRKRLKEQISKYLGDYLGVVIADGGEVEEDDETVEGKQELQQHITFIMKQLEYETIGPAYMETRWHAYSKLAEMARRLAGKTADPSLQDTLREIVGHAETWAQLKTDEGSTRTGHRDALRQEVILVLSGIKV